MALLALLAVSACSRGGDWRTPPAADQGADSQNGYVAPPRFTAAARLGDGETEIVGRADPNSRVRLSSPDGAAYGATTDSRGAFSLAAAGGRQDGQAVRALEDCKGRSAGAGRGLFGAVIPEPGRPAVLLRAGVGAQGAWAAARHGRADHRRWISRWRRRAGVASGSGASRAPS